MKKILLFILAVLLLLPIGVKADRYPVDIFSNDNIVVGGDLQTRIRFGSQGTVIGTITMNYDTDMLSVTKDDIKVKAAGILVNNSQDLTITVEGGVITISSEKSLYSKSITGSDMAMSIDVSFHTLKAGDASVKVQGSYFMNESYIKATIKSSESSVTECKEDKECPVCNCPNSNQESNNDTKEDSETETKEKDDNSNNNIFLYCSLGLNAVLLICLIVVAVKKKSTKTVEKVVEENKE